MNKEVYPAFCSNCSKSRGLKRKSRIHSLCRDCQGLQISKTKLEQSNKRYTDMGLSEDRIVYILASGKSTFKFRCYCPRCNKDKGYRSILGQKTLCYQCSAEKSGIKNRGLIPPNKGKKNSLDTRIKNSCTKQGISVERFTGFITPLNQQLRCLPIMKNLKRQCFVRDNYSCQVCMLRGVELHAHHLNSWKHFPEQRYLLSNLITLCKSCHIEYHNMYGKGTHKNRPANTAEQYTIFKEINSDKK